MRRFLALLFMLVCSEAYAQSAIILESRFGGHVGFSSGDGYAQCVDPAALRYEQCKQIEHPAYATGTFTVTANAEVLLSLRCGGTPVWQGKRSKGPSDFSTAPFPKALPGRAGCTGRRPGILPPILGRGVRSNTK
jgi:hypothetical protein